MKTVGQQLRDSLESVLAQTRNPVPCGKCKEVRPCFQRGLCMACIRQEQYTRFMVTWGQPNDSQFQ